MFGIRDAQDMITFTTVTCSFIQSADLFIHPFGFFIWQNRLGLVDIFKRLLLLPFSTRGQPFHPAENVFFLCLVDLGLK